MTTFITLIALAALVAGLVELITYARHDRFGGPSVRTYPHDEIGTIWFGRHRA